MAHKPQLSGPPRPPRVPAHLAPATRRWWANVVHDYELEEHHRKLLTAAAESWDRMTAARVAVAREGMVFEDRFGQPHARPEVGIERDARLAFARLLRELALDVSLPDDSRPPGLGGRRS